MLTGVLALPVVKLYDEALHPRAPAGTSTGGQWTSDGGSIATVKLGNRNALLDQWSRQLNETQWPEDTSATKRLDDALSLIREVIDKRGDYRDPTDPGIHHFVHLSKEGKILSAISYETRSLGEIHISRLGSLARGEGSRWMRHVDDLARKSGRDITLSALPDAVPFYVKMGFTNLTPNAKRLSDMIKSADRKSDEFDDLEGFDDLGVLACTPEFAQRVFGKSWDESQHPRVPAGEGDPSGEWTSGGGSSEIMFEVAPDPNDAALTARWNKLTDAEKLQVSQEVADKIVPEALQEIGMEGKTHMQIGGYEGATNPSLALDVSSSQDRTKLVPAASLLGHALAQDSMMVVSDRRFAGADPVGVITVHLPGEYANKDVTRIYDRLWKLQEGGEKLVGGHSTMNGQMNIMNFSKLSNEEFARRIDKQLNGRYDIDVRSAFVAFPTKDNYGANLSTGHTVPSGQSASLGFANHLRGQATTLIEQELGRRGKSFKFNPNHQPAGSPEGGEFAARPGAAGSDRPGDEQALPQYAGHAPAPGAVSVIATHFGKTKSPILNGEFYGTGQRGAEQQRLAEPDADPRIKSRIYFYVDEGKGVVPEYGVGAYRSSVKLNNLYNPRVDDGALWRRGGRGDSNRAEAAILDAGYDGYYVPDFANHAGVAVLMGKHRVPVRLERKNFRPALKFSPSQPRAPGGTPIGGEWVAAGDANALQSPMEQSPVKGTGPNGRVTVEDVYHYLDAKTTGPIDFNEPEAIEHSVQITDKEFDYQLQQGQTGLNWYDKNVEQAFRETQKVIPELSHASDRQLFSIVAGIQSQMTPVKTNWVMTAKCYEEYLKSGRVEFPVINPETGMGWGLPQKGLSLGLLNSMIADKGEKGTLKYLFSEHPISELRELRAQQGLQSNHMRGSASTKVLGITMFGPKVGPFAMNLNGIQETTVDRWAIRTFRRQWGSLTENRLEAPTEPERRAVKTIVTRVAKDKGVTPQQVQAAMWVYEQKLYNNLGVRGDEGGKTFLDGARTYVQQRRKP